MAEKKHKSREKMQNSENPFAEEFSPDDVVNTGTSDQEIEPVETDKEGSAENAESFTSSTDPETSDRISEAENNLFDEEQNRLSESFRDFMTLPKIAGTSKSFSHTNHIPEENLEKRFKKVQISDDPEFSDGSHGRSTVIVNRDENDEITSIEVHCKCGERTKIFFDYENETSKDADELSGFKENISTPSDSMEEENSTDSQAEEPEADNEEISEDAFSAENVEANTPESPAESEAAESDDDPENIKPAEDSESK